MADDNAKFGASTALWVAAAVCSMVFPIPFGLFAAVACTIGAQVVGRSSDKAQEQEKPQEKDPQEKDKEKEAVGEKVPERNQKLTDRIKDPKSAVDAIIDTVQHNGIEVKMLSKEERVAIEKQFEGVDFSKLTKEGREALVDGCYKAIEAKYKEGKGHKKIDGEAFAAACDDALNPKAPAPVAPPAVGQPQPQPPQPQQHVAAPPVPDAQQPPQVIVPPQVIPDAPPPPQVIPVPQPNPGQVAVNPLVVDAPPPPPVVPDAPPPPPMQRPAPLEPLVVGEPQQRVEPREPGTAVHRPEGQGFEAANGAPLQVHEAMKGRDKPGEPNASMEAEGKHQQRARANALMDGMGEAAKHEQGRAEAVTRVREAAAASVGVS